MRQPDEIRASILAFMERRGLDPTPWSTESGLSENTLTRFLKGGTGTPTDRTLRKLAESQGVEPGVLTGDIPDPLDPDTNLLPEPSEQAGPREAQMAESQLVYLMNQILAVLRAQQRAIDDIRKAMKIKPSAPPSDRMPGSSKH